MKSYYITYQQQNFLCDPIFISEVVNIKGTPMQYLIDKEKALSKRGGLTYLILFNFWEM